MQLMYRLCICLVFVICVCIGWGSKEKNNVIFSGILTPLDSESLNVDRIMINHRTEFEAYQKPLQAPAPDDNHTVTLSTDPMDVKFGPFKLSSIKTIVVPYPEIDWIYQEKNKPHKGKYTEILIDNTPYLISKTTSIQATNKANQHEITIKKISRLKNLAITGHDVAPKEMEKP